jgi:2-polyprenyl-3-methyl-5-hydroxy-6-metoxy-1,4-benzoquinol methylase
MKHDFNHKAETFDSPKNIFLANLVCQAVEKQIDLLSDKEILDFGGGTGLLALPLAKQAKSVTLVDISEKMLEQARLKADQQDIKNIQFLKQDLLANPLDQQFDLIVVSRVLHHMPDLDATLAMFHHHLREKGQVLIADFVLGLNQSLAVAFYPFSFPWLSSKEREIHSCSYSFEHLLQNLFSYFDK